MTKTMNKVVPVTPSTTRHKAIAGIGNDLFVGYLRTKQEGARITYVAIKEPIVGEDVAKLWLEIP